MATNKSYRELQGALSEVLDKLQSSELDIDESLILYKQGQKLIAQLEKYLRDAKNEISEIKK